MSLGEFPGMSPVHFFRFSCDLHEVKKYTGTLSKHYFLPDTLEFSKEVVFAQVLGAWNAEGLYFIIEGPQESIELFIDTRDVKTSGYNTRFCHHFLITSESAEEVTHFRGLEKRPLADPSLLVIAKSSHRTAITLPTATLHGFDPLQFDRIGFTYRITSGDGFVQHFSCSSSDYKIEEEPSLWASLKLMRGSF